jgi:hypothetical protein
MGNELVPLYRDRGYNQDSLLSPIHVKSRRNRNPFGKFRGPSPRGKVVALGVVTAASIFVNANKEDFADKVMDCPAGFAWSGPAEIKPECEVGLPRPIDSRAEWPVAGSNRETTSGIAKYQITSAAAVEGGMGVVVEFTAEEEGFAEVFRDGYNLEEVTAQDYARNIARNLGAEACVAEMGAIIELAQEGVEGLTTSSTHQAALAMGESIYGIEGHGGNAQGTDATDIFVVTATPQEGGEPRIENVSCLDR